MPRKSISLTDDILNYSYDAGGEVLGLLQTEHSGIGFNPFVNASHTDAERHYFGKDHLGSIRAVTNQWGSPLYMFDYDVFGTPLQDRPERFRHGFTGKEYDSWTGLYNYGFRDYSPLHGRFTTVDPIQDGLGWYAYVNSDPVSWLDPWGLKGQKSGEDPARLVKMVSDQYRPYFDTENFIQRRLEGELNGVAACFQDSLGKLKNFFSNIFSGKSQVETYYSVSVTFGSFSYEATMYVSEAGVTFEIPKTEELLTNTLQQEMKMPIILESNGVSADIPIGIYNSCELSIPVGVSKKEDDFVTLKLGAKASAKSPITDSVGASGSTGYRITASIQDGPHGTIKNRKSKSLNTMVNTYRYYTSSDFLKENLH